MEDINIAFGATEEYEFPSEMSQKESPLLDLESFEKLESSIKLDEEATVGFGSDRISGKEDVDDIFGNVQSGLISTTRPLVTSSDEDISEQKQNISPSIPADNFLDYVNVENVSSLIDMGADTPVEDSFLDPVAEAQQQRIVDGDQLLIGRESSLQDYSSEHLISSSKIEDLSPLSFDKVLDLEDVETLPNIKDPKIVAKVKVVESENYESGLRAYETAAQPVKSEVAMEAEKAGSATENNIECDCPFSPGSWFNPEKLHPTVAQYVYWKDPKKSGVALGVLLILLLSFKYFSVISVAAYLTLALLSVTVSFRIYKSVVQAVQKANDGHPFKDYLELDIALSQDKISQTVETLIHHLNCVSGKFRSLILVEDLVDTLKLGVLAWCMTYVGAWFNGLTLVILGVVSAFTLPKVYETNKTQIDVYAELVRTKGKEVIEMVNAKMPMGKKKKDQ